MTASDSTGPASAAPDNTVRLDDADALIWAVERDPTLASTVSSLSLFDSRVDPEAFRIRLERATRLVVRMRQRVVGNPLSLSPPRWEVDPEFDLDNHLRVVECPGDGTLRDALDLAAPFNAAPFDKERPLFDMLLIQGIDGDKDKTGLVMKAHHAIADGMGMLQIQLELFDFEPDTENPELPPEPQADPLSPGERLGNALEFERGRARTSLRDLGTAVVKNLTSGDGDAMDQALDTVAAGIRSIVPAPPMSPVLVERSADTWHDTMSVPVADLKAAGKRAGTRMNAAFVAAVARGLGLFHEQSGERCPLLRMGIASIVGSRSANASRNGRSNELTITCRRYCSPTKAPASAAASACGSPVLLKSTSRCSPASIATASTSSNESPANASPSPTGSCSATSTPPDVSCTSISTPSTRASAAARTAAAEFGRLDALIRPGVCWIGFGMK